ncbi:broad-complex core protein isoforms 1/2/3/4/5-like [Tigriopus californicus]|uniref:broad-complex core protein isoforms 1/2/3/4/5-like n=1 Tax=Tigriopus californicus TaxID=6832 RepID=UPI0027DA0536|nr:broad-complex core protein isoforms 1/2/3/4/5-like [Tigriopus californicus]
MPTEHFCLKWNNYQTNIVSALGNLKVDEDFVDVTLSCEGRKIKAHKVILSACSDYFKEVFKDNPCSHPVVILRDASFADVEGLVRYVYRGEVDVQPERLQSFLRTAEVLRIKGLADQNLSSSNEGIKKEDSSSQVLSPLALQSLSAGNLAKSIHQQYQQFQLASPPLQQQQQHHHQLQLQQQQQQHLPQTQHPLQIQSSPHISLSPTVSRPLLNPPIKVPVPPTLNRSNTSNNFTSLAQYLSGSPTPVSPISSPLTVAETPVPPKRRKTTPRRHESGNGYLKQPTPPHYSGSTSSLTASPASPPHSNSTEGGDGSLEICEDMERESGRHSSESNECPNSTSSIGRIGGAVTTLSTQTSAFKPHLPKNGLLTYSSASSSASAPHVNHLPPSSAMYKSGSITNQGQDLRMSSGKAQHRASSPMDFHDAEDRPLVIEENQRDEEGGEDEEGNHHESSSLHHAYGETLDLSNKGGSRPNSSHSQQSPVGIGQQTSPLLGLIKSHQASVVTPSFHHHHNNNNTIINNNNNNNNNNGTPLPIMATHINTASVVAPVPVSLAGRVSGGQVLEAALSAAAAHPALGSPVAIAAAAMAVAATTNTGGKSPGQIRRTSTAGSSSSTSSTASSGTSKEQQISAGLIASQGLLLTPGNNLAKATHGKPSKGQVERKASSASPNNNNNSSPTTNITNNNNNNNSTANSATGNGTHPRNRWRCMQPRVCPYCWKTFSNSFNLKQHTINVHIQSQGVTCEICEKVVKNKWYLRKHLVTAHGAPLKRSKDGSGAIKQVNSNTGEGGVSQDDDEEHDMTEEEMDDDDDEEIVVDDHPPVSTKDTKKKSSQAKERKVLASTN